MQQLPRYEYADGSANRYIITSDSLSYVPVRPEESSTGMYSGGEPKKITITQGSYDSLRILFEKAKNNPEVHIKDRIKTSGAVSIVNNQSKEEFILSPGCVEQKEIERVLLGMMK